MGISSLQALSVVVVIYFTPATLISLWICYRCGFGGQFGWLYLAILSVARVVGGALQIASDGRRDSGITTAAELIASVGVTALLLAMLEIIEFIKKAAFEPHDPVPPRLWTYLHLGQYAVFVLYVVGTAISNNKLTKAAAIMVAVIFVMQSGVTGYLVSRPQSRKCDKRLLLVITSSIPFLAVRVFYGMASTFVTSGSSILSDVAVVALLQYLMEFIVIGLYLYTGLSFLPQKGDQSDGHSDALLTGGCKSRIRSIWIRLTD